MRFVSTSWNLFPAIFPCFEILFAAFLQYIFGRELSFITLQVCELQWPWTLFFNSLFVSWRQIRRIASGTILVLGSRPSLCLILLPVGKLEWPLLLPTLRASLSLVPPIPVHPHGSLQTGWNWGWKVLILQVGRFLVKWQEWQYRAPGDEKWGAF